VFAIHSVIGNTIHFSNSVSLEGHLLSLHGGRPYLWKATYRLCAVAGHGEEVLLQLCTPTVPCLGPWFPLHLPWYHSLQTCLDHLGKYGKLYSEKSVLENNKLHKVAWVFIDNITPITYIVNFIREDCYHHTLRRIIIRNVYTVFLHSFLWTTIHKSIQMKETLFLIKFLLNEIYVLSLCRTWPARMLTFSALFRIFPAISGSPASAVHNTQRWCWCKHSHFKMQHMFMVYKKNMQAIFLWTLRWHLFF